MKHILAYLVAAGAVTVFAVPGEARPAGEFRLFHPPGTALKTFGPVAANNTTGPVSPPTYQECQNVAFPGCDAIKVIVNQGRANGHTTHFTLTYPGGSAGPHHSFILWNDTVRSECKPPEDAATAMDYQFCGAEGRDLTTSHPKKMSITDLPPGEYTMTVWIPQGTSRGYTLKGEIEFVTIDRPPRRRTPAPPRGAPVTIPKSPERAVTAVATPEPFPTPTPERFATPGPDGPLTDVELGVVAAGRQAKPIGGGGGLVGKVLTVLAIAAVAGGGGAAVFLRIRRDRV